MENVVFFIPITMWMIGMMIYLGTRHDKRRAGSDGGISNAALSRSLPGEPQVTTTSLSQAEPERTVTVGQRQSSQGDARR